MTKGPLFGKMILFALPLMASGILQLLFNAADTAVVGRFTGPEALAGPFMLALGEYHRTGKEM